MTGQSCAEVSDRLRTLAAEVEQLDGGMAGRIGKLADALGDPVAAALWLGLDAMQVIAPQRLTDGGRTHWLVRLAEGARNAAMLLPILITWAGIALAVSAYNTAVGADRNLASQSFLYLWATGFANHPHLGPTLPGLAVADVVVVLVILLSWPVPSVLEGWLSGGRAARTQELAAELRSAVADASLCLTDALRMDDAGLPQAPPASAVAVIRATAEVALRLERVLEGQARFSEQLSGAVRTVSDASSQIASESRTLRDLAGGLTSSQQEFLQELANERNAHAGLVKGLTDVGAGLQRTLQAIDEQARPLQEIAGQLMQLTTDTRPLLDTIRKAQQQVWNEQASAAESMRSAAERMETIARTVERLAARAARDGAVP